MTTDRERAVVRGWALKSPQGEIDPICLAKYKESFFLARTEEEMEEGWTIVPVEIRELPDATTEDG